MVLTVISISEKHVMIFKTPKLTIKGQKIHPQTSKFYTNIPEHKYEISLLPPETVNTKGLNALLNFLQYITISLL